MFGLRETLVCVCLCVLMLPGTDGHARLVEPPMRSSMWRFGFNVSINYNDNELFCGGLARFRENGGKCGTCGDPYDDLDPPNMAGGKYATGTIGRYFPAGATEISASVLVSAYHKGYYEFRLCAHNSATRRVNQGCLNQNLLYIVEGNSQGDSYKFYPQGVGTENVTLRIPPDMTCTQCILQLRYRTGNSWGEFRDNETDCMGCGIQEEFQNCADISIGYPEPEGFTTLPPYTVTESGHHHDAVQDKYNHHHPHDPLTLLPAQDLVVSSNSHSGVVLGSSQDILDSIGTRLDALEQSLTKEAFERQAGDSSDREFRIKLEFLKMKVKNLEKKMHKIEKDIETMNSRLSVIVPLVKMVESNRHHLEQLSDKVHVGENRKRPNLLARINALKNGMPFKSANGRSKNTVNRDSTNNNSGFRPDRTNTDVEERRRFINGMPLHTGPMLSEFADPVHVSSGVIVQDLRSDATASRHHSTNNGYPNVDMRPLLASDFSQATSRSIATASVQAPVVNNAPNIMSQVIAMPPSETLRSAGRTQRIGGLQYPVAAGLINQRHHHIQKVRPAVLNSVGPFDMSTATRTGSAAADRRQLAATSIGYKEPGAINRIHAANGAVNGVSEVTHHANGAGHVGGSGSTSQLGFQNPTQRTEPVPDDHHAHASRETEKIISNAVNRIMRLMSKGSRQNSGHGLDSQPTHSIKKINGRSQRSQQEINDANMVHRSIDASQVHNHTDAGQVHSHNDASQVHSHAEASHVHIHTDASQTHSHAAASQAHRQNDASQVHRHNDVNLAHRPNDTNIVKKNNGANIVRSDFTLTGRTINLNPDRNAHRQESNHQQNTLPRATFRNGASSRQSNPSSGGTSRTSNNGRHTSRLNQQPQRLASNRVNVNGGGSSSIPWRPTSRRQGGRPLQMRSFSRAQLLNSNEFMASPSGRRESRQFFDGFNGFNGMSIPRPQLMNVNGREF